MQPAPVDAAILAAAAAAAAAAAVDAAVNAAVTVHVTCTLHVLPRGFVSVDDTHGCSRGEHHDKTHAGVQWTFEQDWSLGVKQVCFSSC